MKMDIKNLEKFQNSIFEDISILDSQIHGVKSSRLIRNNIVYMELEKPLNNRTKYEFNFDASGKDYMHSEQFNSMLNVFVQYLKVHKTDKGIKIHAANNRIAKVLKEVGLSKYTDVLPIIGKDLKLEVDKLPEESGTTLDSAA